MAYAGKSDPDMTPQYDPSAEAVEALAKELHEAGRPAYGDRQPFSCMADVWRRMMRAKARFVLRRQHEREAYVVERIKRAQEQIRDKYHASWPEATLDQALVHLAALDAPKVPTLTEAFAACEASRHGDEDEPCVGVSLAAWKALKAAVEREEKR